MSKILHLTLKKKWFDLILSGEKKFEYREIKPYWEKRLFNPASSLIKNHSGLRHYDFIRFRNGYRKDSPTMDVEYLALSIKEFNGRNHYALHLGKVLSSQNTGKEKK